MVRARKTRAKSRAKTRRKTRVETDAFGPLAIPADKLWGAQTQRSLHNFRIGSERMPIEIVHAPEVVTMTDISPATGCPFQTSA